MQLGGSPPRAPWHQASGKRWQISLEQQGYKKGGAQSSTVEALDQPHHTDADAQQCR